MSVLKTIPLFVISLFSIKLSFSQKIILVEKDSANNYHLKIDRSISNQFMPSMQPVFCSLNGDTLVMYRNDINNTLFKDYYLYKPSGFQKVKEYTSKYVGPTKGHYIFEDGTDSND